MLRFFITNRKFTFVLTAFLGIWGLFAASKLTSESFPTVNLGIAIIETVYPGAAAEDIETKITKPIEKQIRTVTGIKDVKSVSQPGYSRLAVRVDIDNYPVDEVMADIERALDRTANLPSDLRDRPTFLEIKSEEFPILEMAVTGPNENRKRDLFIDELKEELEDNKAVLGVSLQGFRERQFQIQLSAAKLDQFHIGINEVIGALAAKNLNVPAGFLKNQDEQRLVRVTGKIKTKTDLENILVRSNINGQRVTLKDVATVVDGAEEARILTRHNGVEAGLVIVTKKANVDILEMDRDLKQRIAALKQKYDNKFEVHVYNDESRRIENRLNILNSNALMGLVLVLGLLIFFLPGRAGFMASLTLPLTILMTFALMPYWQMSLNTVTIAGLIIVLGMLVDNSISIAENTQRLLREGLESQEAVLQSIRELWLPLTMSVLTTVAAFIPMLVAKGIMGQFIKHIPIVVTIALLATLFDAFFLLPARLVSKNKKMAAANSDSSSDRKLDWFDRFVLPRFQRWVEMAVRHPWGTAGVFTLLIAASLVLMVKFNRFILFPTDQAEIYVIRVEYNKGTPLEKTHKLNEELTEQIRQVLTPGVLHIAAKAGIGQVDPSDPKVKIGDNVAILTAFMSEDAKVNLDSEQVLKRLRSEVPKSKDILDIQFEVLTEGPPVGAPINATFRSNDVEQLHRAVQDIMERLGKIDGILDLATDDTISDQELRLVIDEDRMNKLGLNIQTVGSTLQAAIQGLVVSDVSLLNKEVTLQVRLKAEDRDQPQDLNKIKILDQRGNLIPLSLFARFENRDGEVHSRRFDYQRAITVTGNVIEEKITSKIANDRLKEIFASLEKEYPAVSLVFVGLV